MNEVMIGLEVHVQLVNLRTKLFCSCPSDYRGKPPNTNICPICTGMPGTLPSLNKRAVEEALKIAISLGAAPYEKSYFFRKSYFYPDLPKNFQITQYDKAGGYPIAHDGTLELSNGKRVRIERIHMEEDPGRIFYEGGRSGARYALVDYNRSGIALVEIVSSPDMSSADEAREFLDKLIQILNDLGMKVQDFEGSIRCDVNVSYSGGERVEVKNVSGSSQVEKVVLFEVLRQRTLFERGAKVVRETRAWDEKRRITISSRSKEVEAEYRYMPEPDLPALSLGKDAIGLIREKMGGTYGERINELTASGINPEIAKRLARDITLYSVYRKAGSDEQLKSKLASLLVNEVAYAIKNRGVKKLPEDIGGLIEIAKKYDLISDHRHVVELVKLWLAGGHVEVNEGQSKINIESVVKSAIKDNMKKLQGLDDKRKMEVLMGQLVKKYGNANKKQFAAALLKELKLG
ncbi:MAG: Asp-tRNA(Asn)/Glu-tRNA(Gln) amidotransferase subunit GatB [Nitrososphaerota archaeon]|jgi:aspartyl-tRNA(Asn)/glutamyl-tRNA(Gln) amidotransferase subunit B|nr:Asp-tRNA(Asn)/Glu-tRNA(Gln) amidotransferase subunit GatB [Nitrososphaerota archaeon]MDG6927565.1 Asp-tRNA(Asn)/Glu-tRNA(Gln) amidotransferase subunit GatB [Nitrososphaerota archaeon]MDG6930661.1 Asp-tRNA(Asn)/Glu-tRNA(Gln) amidotransferase subunit GatB [Nitrososphaerota archaeon]MDG6932496.1 Asp-tRNA(Asn)/Glu-tRNA(Gln) amidotransferase subunit GatB [Nitrososphaerota archaeon]MDG6936223.1 Asp-tRNA(Asn)/Glu-tRNA(Gln) amidotransferase subunit GatB [Nitrososphaerota archaeon]